MNVIRNILNLNIHLKMAQFVLRNMARIMRSKYICNQILHVGNNLPCLCTLHLSSRYKKHNFKTLLNSKMKKCFYEPFFWLQPLISTLQEFAIFSLTWTVAIATKAQRRVPIRWDTFLKDLPDTPSCNRNWPNKICVCDVLSDSRAKWHNLNWSSSELRHTYGLRSNFEDINKHNQNMQSKINQ